METPKSGAIKPLAFFKEVKTELIKVSWPSREQTIKLTLIVIAISIGVGLFVGGLDILFTTITTLLLKK